MPENPDVPGHEIRLNLCAYQFLICFSFCKHLCEFQLENIGLVAWRYSSGLDCTRLGFFNLVPLKKMPTTTRW